MKQLFTSFPQQASFLKTLTPRGPAASGLSCSGSGERRALSAVCFRPHPTHPSANRVSLTPARIDSICQCHSFSSFLMSDLLQRE